MRTNLTCPPTPEDIAKAHDPATANNELLSETDNENP